MKVFWAALVFFLFAFAGLAAGLLLKRKGLRGGCTPPPGSDRDCQCKSATAANIKAKANRCSGEDEPQEG